MISLRRINGRVMVHTWVRRYMCIESGCDKLKERDHLEDLVVDSRKVVILK
jgi:hypothetical protein